MARFPKNGGIILGGTTAFLVVAAGLWLYSLQGVEPTPADESSPLQIAYPELAFEPLPEVTSADAVRLFTDDVYLVAFIERHGPERATIAARDWAEVAGVTHCHDRAHEIGRMAYQIFGAQAFAYAGHSCKSGAMHGVTESLLSERGTENLAADVETLCATVVRDFFRHQCVHGVGHGLLGWVSYELPDALALCERLANPVDRESCYSGVFMENISGSLAGGMVESDMEHGAAHQHGTAAAPTGDVQLGIAPSAGPAGIGASAVERNALYLRLDDAHYPCDSVDDKYVDACYSVQTYHMLSVHQNDFAAVAGECATLAAELQETCFSSIGRDVGNFFVGDPEGAIRTCGLIESSYRLNCLEEAVQDWFWEEASSEVALDFCGRLQAFDENVRCYWQIAWRASDLYASPQAYRGFCSAFKADYLWLCDFVLFQRLDQFGPQGRTEWVDETPAELREVWNVCIRSFQDAFCEITLFQQLEAFHRSRIEGSEAGA